MANKTEELVLALSEPLAERAGVYIVDVEYKKQNGEYTLCLYIDKEGGVGIDDCESFSREIEGVLDKEDPIENNYLLEVSSPGADRKLTKEREFLYYLGREVDVKLFKPLDNVKEFTGVLKDFKNKTAFIECGEKLYEIPAKEAAYIKLSFRF